MQNNTAHKAMTANEIRDMFDENLAKHMERLIGTSYGIGALPLNLSTLSCMILLTERENEIENFPSDESERFYRETLRDELSEIGIDSNESMEKAINDMIQKDYIHMDDDGRFFAGKPTITTARLLDRIFPKMPGMNFIAYFIQTMDEVLTGRKDPDFAISQFNQILRMQGVPLKKDTVPEPEKESRSPDGKKTRLETMEAPRKEEKRVSFTRRLKLSDMYEYQKAVTVPETPSVVPSESRVPSSSEDSDRPEIKEVDMGDPSSTADESTIAYPEPDEVINTQKRDIPQEKTEEKPTGETDTQSPYVPSESPQEDLSNTDAGQELDTVDSPMEPVSAVTQSGDLLPAEEKTLNAPGDSERETGLLSIEIQEEEKEEPDPGIEEDKTDVTEESIEERIAAFEEDLAMQCPICNLGNVKTEETAKGKIYYKCSNENCNFISWGKPYHISCPRCNNPFLIEGQGRDGITVLKCPRATCRHRQNLPGETTGQPNENILSSKPEHGDKPANPKKSRKRRRVVRRKVVRRKR